MKFEKDVRAEGKENSGTTLERQPKQSRFGNAEYFFCAVSRPVILAPVLTIQEFKWMSGGISDCHTT
eukprot:5371309-Amphidinium_carterae.1